MKQVFHIVSVLTMIAFVFSSVFTDDIKAAGSTCPAPGPCTTPMADVQFIVGHVPGSATDYVQNLSAGFSAAERELASYGISSRFFSKSVGVTIQGPYSVSGGYQYTIGSPGNPLYTVFVESGSGGFRINRASDGKTLVSTQSTYGGVDIDLHASGHGYSMSGSPSGSSVLTSFSCGHDKSSRTISIGQNGIIHVSYNVNWWDSDGPYRSLQPWFVDNVDTKVVSASQNPKTCNDYGGSTNIGSMSSGTKHIANKTSSSVIIDGCHTGTWTIAITPNYTPTYGEMTDAFVQNSWRSGAKRFVVLISDVAIDNPSGRQQFVDALRAAGSSLLVITTPGNQAFYQNLISEVGSGSVYTFTGNPSQDLQIIKNLIFNGMGGLEIRVMPTLIEASRGQKVTLTVMTAYPGCLSVPVDWIRLTLPDGRVLSPQANPVTGRYMFNFDIPELTGQTSGYPKDGKYRLEFSAKKGQFNASACVELLISGNPKEKLYIRQYQF